MRSGYITVMLFLRVRNKEEKMVVKEIAGKQLVLVIAMSFVFITLLLVVFANRVNGASLTTTLVRFDRMKISTPTTGTVCANAPTSATETSVKVTFPTGYTVSSTVGNWTVSTANTTGWPAGASAWTGIGAPTGVGEFVISGQSVNFQSGNINASTLYCFNWTNSAALTTKGTATADNSGSVTTQTTGGVASDTGSYATATISEDSIVVTATVAPTFNFAFNNTTADAFGNLSTAAVSTTTGKTITLTTNANGGWIVWAKSANGVSKGSLTSAASGGIITSASALGSVAHNITTGTEDYGLGVTVNTDASGGGTVSLDNAYDGTGTCPSTCNVGVLDSQSFRTIASSNGPAAGDIINVFERASINGSTKAANDYTDIITFIGAGNF